MLCRLSNLGYQNVLIATRDQLDLLDQAAVNYWFLKHHAAARGVATTGA